MQISAATLLASQQATPARPRPGPGFAAALAKTDGFEPLPLKKMAHTEESPAAVLPQAGPARLGTTLDIRV